MKIFTVDKTEKIEMGKIIEYRGNFEEIINEDGEISYSADMFRTTKKTDTFESLYQNSVKVEKIAFLSDTNYISQNRSDLRTDTEKEEFDSRVSDTFNISNAEIIKKRAEYVKDLNSN